MRLPTLAFKIMLGFIVSLVLIYSATAAKGWRNVNPGIQYRDLGTGLSPWSHVHVFRLNLSKVSLSLIRAPELSRRLATAEQYANFSHALLAINGGFFDNQLRALGLRIQNHIQTNPLKPISWWGVFYTKYQKAHISSMQQFHANSSIDFALQSGPRLLIHGQIPALKPGRDERTALGITASGELIIVVTEHTPLTTSALAKLMQSAPLNCREALNLDGGSSTQLSAHMKGLTLNVYGFSSVSDGIIVKARSI